MNKEINNKIFDKHLSGVDGGSNIENIEYVYENNLCADFSKSENAGVDAPNCCGTCLHVKPSDIRGRLRCGFFDPEEISF